MDTAPSSSARSVIVQLWPIYLAYLISQLGNWMFRASVVYEIYDKQRGSSILLGGTVFLIYIPIFLGGRFLAPLADRFESKKVLIFLDILRSVILIPLLIWSQLTDLSTVYLALCTVVMLSLSSPLFTAAQSAYIRRTVDKEQIVSALAIVSNLDWVTYLFGNVIGSVLLLSLNFRSVIFIDIMTFIVSIAILITFLRREHHVQEHVSILSNSTNSLNTNTNYRYYLLWAIFFLNMGAGVINIYPNVAARDIFNTGPSGLSYIYLGNGIGGFMGAFLVHKIKDLLTPLSLIILACISIAISIFGMSLFSYMTLAVVSSSAMLFFGQIFAVVANSYLLRTHPVEQAGRISGLFTAATFSGVAANALLFTGFQSNLNLQGFTMFLIFCMASALFALVPLILYRWYRQQDLEVVRDLA